MITKSMLYMVSPYYVKNPTLIIITIIIQMGASSITPNGSATNLGDTFNKYINM